MGRTICSAGWSRAGDGDDGASAAPKSAPSGNRVRPTNAMLIGRTNPATPTTHHAVSNSRQSANGELHCMAHNKPAL